MVIVINIFFYLSYVFTSVVDLIQLHIDQNLLHLVVTN